MLDRTAPILPVLPGTPESATHDYKRSGNLEPVCRAQPNHRDGDRPLRSRQRAIELKKSLRTLHLDVP